MTHLVLFELFVTNLLLLEFVSVHDAALDLGKFNVASVTFTETVRTIRDGEPRTSTLTFTQLLSSLFHAALRPQRPWM